MVAESVPSPGASAARRVRPERRWQAVRRTIVAAVLRVLLFVVQRLPYGLAGWLGARLGGLGYWLNRRESQRALDNLARAFPERPPAWHRRTARRMFRHVGRITAEFIRSLRWTPAQRLRRLLVNADEYVAAITADATDGRGAVCMTGHFGSWEIIGAMTPAIRPLAVVARRPNDPRIARLADRLRTQAGATIVYQDDSPRALFRTLRDHGVVAILADQDVRRLPGIFVPFFGRDAYTITSPVEIAQRAKATLRMYLCVRERRGYRVIIGERIDVGTKAQGEAALRRGTLAWTQFLEATIREHPHQWMWMHRRWRTRPEDVAADRAADARAAERAPPPRH